MDLKLSLHMAKRSTRSDIRSSNVVGMIEGSDPKLKNEYVVLSAHLDHLGVNKEMTGDNIFNGAMDNASGVATMLETARMFSQGKARPKRSILFVALTGEEKGLLGADYFASNPTVPLASIVANVNLDMPLLTYDFKNVVAFGAEHSSLKGAAASALAKLGLGLIPDPWPEQGVFTRSDHYMFVKQGVPSIFLATGMGSFKKDEDPPKIWGEFFAKYYRQASDDTKLPFNYDAAARFAQLNYMIALEIADTRQKPTWNKGDFFGDTFKK
jgi:Zn-dependent M28 family amino/carboxypeptidase